MKNFYRENVFVFVTSYFYCLFHYYKAWACTVGGVCSRSDDSTAPVAIYQVLSAEKTYFLQYGYFFLDTLLLLL